MQHSPSYTTYRAYGSLHRGSYSLGQRFIVIEEAKESSFKKERIRHCYIQCFKLDTAQGSFWEPDNRRAPQSLTPSARSPLQRVWQFLIHCLITKLRSLRRDPTIQVVEHCRRLEYPVIVEPSLQIFAQFFDNLQRGDILRPARDLFDSLLDGFQGLILDLGLQLLTSGEAESWEFPFLRALVSLSLSILYIE